MSRAETEKRINSAKYDLEAALEMLKEDDTEEAISFLEYAQATIKETLKQLKFPRRS